MAYPSTSLSALAAPGKTPATNAIGTLMLVTSTIVIVAAVVVQRRMARRTAAPALLGVASQAADSIEGS